MNVRYLVIIQYYRFERMHRSSVLLLALLFTCVLAQDTPSVTINTTVSPDTFVDNARDRILTCNRFGPSKPFVNKIECTNALMTIRQSPEGVVFTTGPPYVNSWEHCHIITQVVDGGKEWSNWLALHMAAMQVIVSCSDNNGVSYGGSIRTGPSGRLKLTVGRGPKAPPGGDQSNSGENVASSGDVS